MKLMMTMLSLKSIILSLFLVRRGSGQDSSFPQPQPHAPIYIQIEIQIAFFLARGVSQIQIKIVANEFFPCSRLGNTNINLVFSSCWSRRFLAILSHFAGKGIRRFAETKLQQIPRTSHSEKWQTRSNLRLGCGRFSYLRWKTGFHQWRYEEVSMADGDGDHLAWWLDWSCYYWWWWRWWWYTGLIIILMMVMVKMMK